jgi:hypothetical protein
MCEERKERSRKLCKLLVARVGEVASPGLGNWPQAWDFVEAATDRFLDALSSWEGTGEETDMDLAKREAVAAVDAWREADRLFRLSTSPGDDGYDEASERAAIQAEGVA